MDQNQSFHAFVEEISTRVNNGVDELRIVPIPGDLPADCGESLQWAKIRRHDDLHRRRYLVLPRKQPLQAIHVVSVEMRDEENVNIGTTYISP